MAKSKQQQKKKKERERRIAKEKLADAAKRRSREQSVKGATSSGPRPRKIVSQSPLSGTNQMPPSQKSSFVHRRTGE